jgi:hypothetical protein
MDMYVCLDKDRTLDRVYCTSCCAYWFVGGKLGLLLFGVTIHTELFLHTFGNPVTHCLKSRSRGHTSCIIPKHSGANGYETHWAEDTTPSRAGLISVPTNEVGRSNLLCAPPTLRDPISVRNERPPPNSQGA